MTPEFIWYFDNFHSAVWRDRWRKVHVSGETQRSWILRDPIRVGRRKITRVPKSGMRGFAMAEADIARLEWVEVHKGKIVEQIRASTDAELLMRIGMLLKYRP